MSSSPENEAFLTPEDEQPDGLFIRLDGENYFLEPDNTIVRKFDFEEGEFGDVGPDEFDHVLHMFSPNKGILIFLKNMDPESLELVEAENFLSRTDPMPDEYTFAGYANMVAKRWGDAPPANL